MRRNDILIKYLDNIEYGNAIQNIKTRWGTSIGDINIVLNQECEVPRHAISGAFSWSLTNEGHDYWHIVSNKIES